MNFFDFKIPEDCICEVCGNMAVDVHHIDSRGMGGDPKGNKDVIENLQALCRFCHNQYGDVPEYVSMLLLRHVQFIKRNERNKTA